MNSRLQRSVVALLALALFLTLAGTVGAQDAGGALVRFVHAIPQAPAVDIYTDGQLTIAGLDYGQATGYVSLPAGAYQLSVTAAGDTVPLWEQSINPATGTALTLIAAPGTPLAFVTYQDDLTPLALGKARFAAVHAIPEAPAVDVALADGQVAIPNLQFGQAAGSLDLDSSFIYDFVVVPAGGAPADALLNPDALALVSGTSYVLVVYGPAESPAALLLTAPTAAQGNSGLVRLVHGVAGAPAVDVYLNDTLVAPSLEIGGMTEHVAIPAGTYDAALKVAGSDDVVLEGTLTVEAGQAVTVAALGTADDISLQVLPDDVSGMDATQARISLLNGIPGGSTVTATLADGTTVATDLSFGETGIVSIPAAIQGISLAVTANGATDSYDIPAQPFYGGVYYNLIAYQADGAAQLTTRPTAVNQGIASAPGAAEVVVAPPEVAVQPTAGPTAAPTAELPIARALINPDANLQLRQYPNPNALSLGLAPSNATFIVNGRIGPEALPAGMNPPANATEYVDPASQLSRNQDLIPAETWLNVTYETPDGGSITAWLNAQFLSVSDADGKPVRLADLPLIPMNRAGEAVNTGVTPPPIPVDRIVATVFNLDPGVNLNIRRVASTDGEVLARIPNGTVLEFVSVTEALDWAFIVYSPPEGGTISGWVNTLYIQYTLNGKPIDYAGMEEKELLVISDGTERGEVTAGISPIERPTLDPLADAIIADVVLDPGSNLNLRRNPNVDSEVLAQIPSGSRLVVLDRTGDGTWLRVTFEGAEGWIAARTENAVFVRLSQKGKQLQIEAVPLAPNEEDVEPGVTPAAPSAPDAQPTLELTAVPIVITDAVIQMTGSPGGSADDLPILSQGQPATLLFTDGRFSYIELENGTRGWIPAGAAKPR